MEDVCDPGSEAWYPHQPTRNSEHAGYAEEEKTSSMPCKDDDIFI